MTRGIKHSDELKKAVIADYKGGEKAGGMKADAVAKKHGIPPSNVYVWWQQTHGSRAKKKLGTAIVPAFKKNGRRSVIPGTKINASSMENAVARMRGVWLNLERGERRLIKDIRAGRVDRIRGASLDLVNALAELTEPED